MARGDMVVVVPLCAEFDVRTGTGLRSGNTGCSSVRMTGGRSRHEEVRWAELG